MLQSVNKESNHSRVGRQTLGGHGSARSARTSGQALRDKVLICVDFMRESDERIIKKATSHETVVRPSVVTVAREARVQVVKLLQCYGYFQRSQYYGQRVANSKL